MRTRGEKNYVQMPVFAAGMYDDLTNINGVNMSFIVIARFLQSRIKQGKLLDIGTGPGRLLCEINKEIPELKLFGIDISPAMLRVAKRNLINIKNVELRTGNIVQSGYPGEFFDCILSTGSFYNWDKPVEGLNEIYRILKTGKTAYIFETTRDFDRDLLNSRVNENLKGYNFLRRVLSKYFLNKQLGMTYSMMEFKELVTQSYFRNSYQIEKIELGKLPVYVRMELNKIKSVH